MFGKKPVEDKYKKWDILNVPVSELLGREIFTFDDDMRIWSFTCSFVGHWSHKYAQIQLGRIEFVAREMDSDNLYDIADCSLTKQGIIDMLKKKLAEQEGE